MAQEKVLIVEDDSELLEIIQSYLAREGYQILLAQDGAKGCQLAREEKPDLVILDIMLPEVDGIEVCRDIRTYSQAPIITISAKNSDYDKIMSLGTGSDDYLTKPFSMLELVARVRSHLRRYTSYHREETSQNENPNIRTYGKLSIDSKAYKVTVNGEEISFTSREFQLIDFLSLNPSIVFSKEQLMDQVWGVCEYIDENTIAVYVARIREKLQKYDVNCIKTVWGVGYKWES